MLALIHGNETELVVLTLEHNNIMKNNVFSANSNLTH